MLKMYYTLQKTQSHPFLFRILKEYHGIPTQPLLYNAHGKPYLKDDPVFFSLTHSGNLTAVAVGDTPVGLDAEYTEKRSEHVALLKRLSPAERAEITDMPAFFLHWTVKESYVKFCGETLAALYPKLIFANGVLSLNDSPLKVHLQSGTLDGGKYRFTLCTENTEKTELYEVIS